MMHNVNAVMYIYTYVLYIHEYCDQNLKNRLKQNQKHPITRSYDGPKWLRILFNFLGFENLNKQLMHNTVTYEYSKGLMWR